MAESLKNNLSVKTSSDKLGQCLIFFSVLWGTLLLLTVFVVLSSVFLHRSLPGSTLQLVKNLDLTVLSLIPSGQVFRNPEGQHAGVDLRMMPGLPLVRIESAALLLSTDGL